MPESGREPNEPADGDFTAIALIRKPVGLKGWVAVAVFGRTLERLVCPYTVMVGRSEQRTRRMTLADVHRDPKGFRCRFAECTDRDGAELLREQTLFLPSGRLPSLEEGEFYHFELEGMVAVAAEDGNEMGRVVAVHNYPTTDAVEIRLRSGGTVMVPMAGEVIEEIKREERTIVVRAALLEELL